MPLCPICNIDKPLSEYYPHATHSSGRSYECKQCHLDKAKEYRERNKEKLKEKRREYLSGKGRDPEILKVRKNKPNMYRPKWLSPAQLVEIERVRFRAIELTILTGVKHVVDHIVPLQHPEVCGLDVPWNMRAITEEENLRKGNKFESEW